MGAVAVPLTKQKTEKVKGVKNKFKQYSKSRVKLNISVVKTLTVVADRPTVYVSVTLPCNSTVLVQIFKGRKFRCFRG